MGFLDCVCWNVLHLTGLSLSLIGGRSFSEQCVVFSDENMPCQSLFLTHEMLREMNGAKYCMFHYKVISVTVGYNIGDVFLVSRMCA